MRWCSPQILFSRKKLHKNCAICASPTQRERFHFAGSLFHTLFNRTVENFHTTFTFTFIFCLSLVRELLCGFFSWGSRDGNSFLFISNRWSGRPLSSFRSRVL